MINRRARQVHSNSVGSHVFVTAMIGAGAARMASGRQVPDVRPVKAWGIRSRTHDRSSLPGGCPASDTVAPVALEPHSNTGQAERTSPETPPRHGPDAFNSKRFIRKHLLSLKSVLGFGVAVRAQVVSFRRLVLAFPRLVAVIPYRAHALVCHSNPLLRRG